MRKGLEAVEKQVKRAEKAWSDMEAAKAWAEREDPYAWLDPRPKPEPEPVRDPCTCRPFAINTEDGRLGRDHNCPTHGCSERDY